MKHYGAICLAAALSAAGLISCTSRADLAIGPASPALRQELSRLAAEYSRSHALRIALDDQAAKGATISIGWTFFRQEDAKARRIAPDRLRKDGYATAPAFERLARDGRGWLELPLLWDAWGVAGPAADLERLRAGKAFAWKDRAKAAGTKPVLVGPGGDPGLRQALFWVGGDAPAAEAMAAIALGGSGRDAAAARSLFAALASLPRDKSIYPETFRLKFADVDNLARQAAARILLGSYSWQRSVPGQGRRDFLPLEYPLGPGYGLPVSILTGTVRGEGRAAAMSEDFLIWLSGADNQGKLSYATGLMAANFHAANLDPNALRSRDAALGAASLVPIDPDPARGSKAESWDSLLGRVLAKPAEWARVVAERENQ